MIFDKPFSFAEMLRRTVFLGRPNFFNAKDFNKEMLIIHNFVEEFNKIMAVGSDVEFSIPSFTDVYSPGTDTWTRSVNLNWTAGTVLYKGVRFTIVAGGSTGFTQVYNNPDGSVDPKEVKPPTYIVLTGTLATLTYADNPALCGIQADDLPASVATVNVEQWKDLEIKLTADPTDVALGTVICVLGTIHPKYKLDGTADGYGFIYNTFKNPTLTLKNGDGNQVSNMQCNKSLFEYLLERTLINTNNLINERQLIRRFDLADLANAGNARHNIGFSKLVNYRQLVQDENFRDVLDKPLARFNLGLGTSATANIGFGANDVAPGNVLPVGGIIMWAGAPSSIPASWKLCDGSNDTPNMKGLFAVGLDTAIVEFNTVGKTGGSMQFTLAIGNVPAHRHAGTFVYPEWGSNVANWTIFNQAQTGGKSAKGGKMNTSDDGIDTQTDDLDSYAMKFNTGDGTTNIDNQDGLKANPDPVKHIMPYFVVCYIQYKGSTIAPVVPPVNPPALVYPNFSAPDNSTDGGYSTWTPVTVGGSNGIDIGSGIILTNPE